MSAVFALNAGPGTTGTCEVGLWGGHVGDVRLGLRVSDGKVFAIKLIDVQRCGRLQKKHRVRLALCNEVRLLRWLRHPGVISCSEFFEAASTLYLVMALMAGGGLLRDIFAHGRFSELHSHRLFEQLCEAVKYLHGADVTHRDLKPDNVLLNPCDRDAMHGKLAGFVSAHATQGAAGCETYCGTSPYVAPEVILAVSGLGTCGKPAGMRSLGATLYVVRSGRFPFSEDDILHEVLEARCGFMFDEWRRVSETAQGLVTALVTADVFQRLTRLTVLHKLQSWRQQHGSTPVRRRLRDEELWFTDKRQRQANAAVLPAHMDGKCAYEMRMPSMHFPR